jgi:transposase-like protein
MVVPIDPLRPQLVRSELQAYLLLEKLRWGGEPPGCPLCGGTGRQYFLNPANGTSRRTRTGATSERRVWKCGHCRRQYSVLTGTVFAGTRISIRTWLAVIVELCRWRNSLCTGEPSAGEISRRYAITHESARHLLRRLQVAAAFEPVASLLAASSAAGPADTGG